MAGIFDRGPSAVLGELLGGAFGVSPAQAGPAQAPAQSTNRLPDPADVTRFMEQNNIPMTDGGITEAIAILSRQQGLTPSPQQIEESIFSPAVTPAQRAAPQQPGFTDPASIGLNPQLTPAQTAQDQVIQQQVENDNRDPQQFDNVPAGAAGGGEVPVDAIVAFAQQNNIPLTDGGIHEAAKAVMGPAYNFELIEAGIRGGANPQ